MAEVIEERCELTELLVATCGHCKAKHRDPGPVWAAKYPGTCTYAACHQKAIEVGDLVKWDETGEHTIHERHRPR